MFSGKPDKMETLLQIQDQVKNTNKEVYSDITVPRP